MVRRFVMGLAVLPLVAGALVAAGVSPASAAATCQHDVRRTRPLGASEVVWYIPGYWTGSTYSTSCALRQGDSTYAVKRLQSQLNLCYNQGLTVDGDFGPATRRALMNAQTWERVVRGRQVATDGVYGPQTRDAMHWNGLWGSNHYCIRLDGTINHR